MGVNKMRVLRLSLENLWHLLFLRKMLQLDFVLEDRGKVNEMNMETKRGPRFTEENAIDWQHMLLFSQERLELKTIQ